VNLNVKGAGITDGKSDNEYKIMNSMDWQVSDEMNAKKAD